ncbi:MAG: alpha-2-macroglobulin, partial [Blastocatellia bacterium]|nr:alpha-2-macroglobulin [Blastocatellia bacterium]
VNYRQLKVALYKVTAEDWYLYRLYQTAKRYQKTKAPIPPGKLVFDKFVDLTSKPDELSETAIDLSPALTNGYGQVFVQVDPVEENKDPVRIDADLPEGHIEAWVQATDIGLDAFVDKNSLVAWANSLHDGHPLGGVEIRVMPDDVTGTTEANGLARFAFKDQPQATEPDATGLLVARRGDDVAILPQSIYPNYRSYGHGWRSSDSSESIGWYVFDDRRLYRPGEEVNVKGWIRKVNLSPLGDTELYGSAGESVNYILKDSQDNEVTKGKAILNALAGFDLKLQLPGTMNLGVASLEFDLGDNGGKYTHNFRVEEFRRPEFEITAQVSEALHFIGSSATATMKASYYTGGGLANTEVNWTVISQPTNYTPPNRDDYTFGKYYAWWRGDREHGESKQQTLTGKTDADGIHALRMDFDGVNPPRPSTVVAEARVQDVNRQTIAATTTFLVHPADTYVGLKPARNFVQKGEPFDLAAIVTDLDGKALSNHDVKLRLVRLEYVYEKGEWKERETDAHEQSIRSGLDPMHVHLATSGGGEYRLTAQVRDDRERLNETELLLWVAGGKILPTRKVEQEKVDLIPDRKSYAASDVAEILLQSPFYPA